MSDLNIRERVIQSAVHELNGKIEYEIMRALQSVWPGGYSTRDILARCKIERRHGVDVLQVDGRDLLEIHGIEWGEVKSGQHWVPDRFRVEFKFRRLYEVGP